MQAGLSVEGIMGTSAGALTGSLYAAGYTPKQVGHS
jgi:predicted acylesterase/phospholipase RssA